MTGRGAKTLGSVWRTIRVVEIVAARGAVRVSDLAVALGISKTGAFRIAQSLVAHRWLTQGEDRRYRLGPALRNLADTDALSD